MAKMGRPKSDEVKDKIVTLRMSVKEYTQLVEYAKSHQMTITEILKRGIEFINDTP